MRDFCEVVTRILEVAPEPLKSELRDSAPFWAPEIRWSRLTYLVNALLAHDSSSPSSVSVYAILCDCTEEEMIRRFEASGC